MTINLKNLQLNLKSACKRSFRLYCEHIIHQPIGQMHVDIINQIETNKKNTALLAFRGSYKSWIWSRAFPTYKIFQNDTKPVHTIIQSMNQDMSRQLLSLNRDILNANPAFESYSFKRETDKLLEVYLPEKKGVADMTHKIWSVPFGTRGLHGDYVITDDIQKDEDGNTSMSMKKLKRLFWNATYPMSQARDGLQISVGTPISFDDLFSDFKKKAAEGADWQVLEYPIYYIDINGNMVPNFPERYPLTKIEKIQRDSPTWSFAQEYLLQPIGSDDAIFPLDLLEESADIPYPEFTKEESERKTYYFGADVAMSGKHSADYSAFFVVSKAPNRPLMVEDIWHEKGVKEPEQIKQLVNLKRTYFPQGKGFIEQKGLTYSMANLVVGNPELAHIMECWNPTNEEKAKIVGNLQLLLRHKMLIIPKSIPYYKDLIMEMNNFGIVNENGVQKMKALTGHDDLVIGLALAVAAAGGWVYDIESHHSMAVI